MIYLKNPYLYFYIFVSEYFNEYKVHCDLKFLMIMAQITQTSWGICIPQTQPWSLFDL